MALLGSCGALGGGGGVSQPRPSTGGSTPDVDLADAALGDIETVPFSGGEVPDQHGQGPLMRVGLAEGLDEVRVACDGPCSVTLFGETTARASVEDGQWVFTVDDEGVTASGPSVEGIRAGTVRIAPHDEAPVSAGGVAYRGEIEVFRSSDGGLSVVNIVGLESYLRGVVPQEIGPRTVAELEAVKAQAVAARTYALARGGGRSAGDYDLYATVEDQAYGGVRVEDPVGDRAIAETAGQVLYYGDAPVNAYFSSCCGGWTAAREDVWELPPEPYLVSQSDVPGNSGDLDQAYCSGSPNFTWEVEWAGDELLELVRTRLRETASAPVTDEPSGVLDIRVTGTTGRGRVASLLVETPEGAWTVLGDRVRWLLRRPGSDAILRSAWFELETRKAGGRVTWLRAEGRGYGHGVGMCQHGALGMARQGLGYRQILGHYYPGTRLDSPAGYWD